MVEVLEKLPKLSLISSSAILQEYLLKFSELFPNKFTREIPKKFPRNSSPRIPPEFSRIRTEFKNKFPQESTRAFSRNFQESLSKNFQGIHSGIMNFSTIFFLDFSQEYCLEYPLLFSSWYLKEEEFWRNYLENVGRSYLSNSWRNSEGCFKGNFC